MELLKHELYKIITRKSIYFATVILLLLYSLPLIELETGIMQNSNWHETAKTFKDWEGPVTREKVHYAEEILEEGVLYETNVYGPADINITIARDILNTQEKLSNWNNKMAGLQTEIIQLEQKNSASYEYKEKIMAYEAFHKVGPPEIYYNNGWTNIVDFVKVYGLIFMGALILLGISPVFSEEYSNGTDNFILPSKKGKSSVITAKILASFIYILILVMFFASINILVNWYRFGLAGWDTPIRNLFQYFGTPYALDLWQYYIIQVGIHAMGAMAFGLVVLAISAVSRSALIPFFAGGVIFAIPMLLTSIFNVEIPWVLRLVEFSHTEFMKVAGLFTNFKVFNIFGYPVLYLNAALIFFAFVSAIVANLIYYKFRNHQVS